MNADERLTIIIAQVGMHPSCLCSCSLAESTARYVVSGKSDTAWKPAQRDNGRWFIACIDPKRKRRADGHSLDQGWYWRQCHLIG